MARRSSQSICAVSPPSSDISCHKVCHHKTPSCYCPRLMPCQTESRPFTAKMDFVLTLWHVLSAIFTSSSVFSALTPSVWPFCRSLFLPSSSDFLFLLFRNFFKFFFFSYASWILPRIMRLTTVNVFETLLRVMGVNAIHSTPIRIHYIALGKRHCSAIHLSFSEKLPQ